jgi:hypothetical protein
MSVTLAVFFVLYSVLLLTFLWFALRIVLQGPTEAGATDPRTVRPGLDRAGPAAAGAYGASPEQVAAASFPGE